MRQRVLTWLGLLAIVLGLSACGVKDTVEAVPTPRPVATTDVAGITLVPYTNKDSGFSGVVPDGWVEVLRGARRFGGDAFLSDTPDTNPGTVLIQHLEGGATLDEAIAVWLPRLGLEELPERVARRETASFTWDLYAYEQQDPRMGARRVDLALAETDYGVYIVVLGAMADEYGALHDAVFMPAVDALAPAVDLPSRYQDHANRPVIATIDHVGNNAHETVEFTLGECTGLHIYAIGEGSQGRMDDWGYIENEATGQIIWQMYFFETESAGYYRNRRVDRVLSLPAGTYRLHFQTNEAHSFEDWGDRPPGHSFWGITLFEATSPDGGPSVCWERPSRPEELGWSSEKLQRIVPDLQGRGVAALMVVTDGQVVFEWGNTANNFYAHSMRKSLMSALYGVALAEGKIDTSKTLKELGIDDLTPLTEAEKEATVAELLKARSGVYIPAAGEVQSMRDARPKRGSHKHGTFWYYNNWDFNALGTIFEQETGENIYQAFKTWIADPIGMQDFGTETLRYTYEYWLSWHPYYGFRISARDLARFGQLYLQEGEWQGAQLIPAEWVEQSTQPHSSTGGSGTYSGYGYMWWIAARDFSEIKQGSYAASGYGGHTLEVLPHLNTVIVFRVNTDDPNCRPISDEDQLVVQILEAREDR